MSHLVMDIKNMSKVHILILETALQFFLCPGNQLSIFPYRGANVVVMRNESCLLTENQSEEIKAT